MIIMMPMYLPTEPPDLTEARMEVVMEENRYWTKPMNAAPVPVA